MRSAFIQDQFPRRVQDQFPLFVEFMRLYYAWMEAHAGELIGVKVVSGGSGYSNYPSITDSTDLGTQFTPKVSGGRITSVGVDGHGIVYPPDVAITATDSIGSGAILQAVLVPAGGGYAELLSDSAAMRAVTGKDDVFLAKLKTEFLSKLPLDLAATETDRMISFIRQFHNSAGTESAIRFIYRALFNADVEFYYPKTDMFDISGSSAPSSRKKIQDSTYYQEFSYEIQAPESMGRYPGLLDDLAHPAGMLRFILLTLQSYVRMNLGVGVELNTSFPADVVGVVTNTHHTRSLGPTIADLDIDKAFVPPNSYVDVTLLVSSTPGTPISAIVLPSAKVSTDNEYTNFTAILTSGVSSVKTVTSYNSSTRTLTFDSSFTPSNSTTSIRLLENRRIAVVNNSPLSMTVQLAANDPYLGMVHEVAYGRLYITSGPGSGQMRQIVSFDGTTLVYDGIFTPSPTTDSTYYILKDLYTNSGYYAPATPPNGLPPNGDSSFLRNYHARGGFELSVPTYPSVFRQAKARGFISGTSLASVVVDDPGAGYTKVPSVRKTYGGGSGVVLTATLVAGSIPNINITSSGHDLESNPNIIVDPPSLYPGEMVYQAGTGARGIVMEMDTLSNILYVRKNLFSPDFDSSPVVVDGIILPVTQSAPFSLRGVGTSVAPMMDLSIYYLVGSDTITLSSITDASLPGLNTHNIADIIN